MNLTPIQIDEIAEAYFDTGKPLTASQWRAFARAISRAEQQGQEPQCMHESWLHCAKCDHPAPASQPVGEAAATDLQWRVQPWMLACFGAEIAADAQERNHRFLEEALELVQACGATASEAHQLVDYVYGRPAGEKAQEVGGVMVTLAALCLAQGIDMHAAGETELARIWTKVESIRAKQAAKPKHSPLPQHATSVARAGLSEADVAAISRAAEWLEGGGDGAIAEPLRTLLSRSGPPGQEGTPQNPYRAQGSLEEAWRRGYDGQPCIAYHGSNYERAWKEGRTAAYRSMLARHKQQEGRDNG